MNRAKNFLRLTVLTALVLAVAGFMFMDTSWGIPPHQISNSRNITQGLRAQPDQATLEDISARLQSIIGHRNIAAKTVPSPASDAQGGGLSYYRNEYNGTPVFMSGDSVSMLKRAMGKIASGTPTHEIALQFITANSDIFKLENPRDELKLVDETVSADGKRHIQFDQYYHGIPLWEHRLVVHLDKNSEPYAFNARYSPTPTGFDVGKISFGREQALEKAKTDLSASNFIMEPDDFMKTMYSYDGPTAELVIQVDRESQKPLLTWHVTIRPNMKDQWHYFIDAANGDIVEKYNAAVYYTSVVASGKDALGVIRQFNVADYDTMYYMFDDDANIYTYDAQGKVLSNRHRAVLVASRNDIWQDSISVSAHSNSREVFDYYLEKHNRRGMDGNGMKLPVVIHYTEDGTPLYNAFWSGGFIAFGDADIFAAALDVVAHELTHAVVQYTVGLDYKYDAGALNEAFADAMACMVDPDWEIGEDLSDGPLRDVENPERFGLPATMDGYKTMPLSQDNGGVHYNMSIPSRACALTADVIGRDKTARIWYGILNKRYLTPQAGFGDMRLGAIQSSTDLFGADSDETKAVASAFDEVGIVNAAPSKPPADIPPPDGEPWVAFIVQNRLYLGKSTVSSSSDIIQPTQTQVNSETSCPIAVSSDGTFLLFVDSANNLRHLDLNTFKETLINDSASWSSIALSPDNYHLAMTTTNRDNKIYITDLQNPGKSTPITLYTASTEGVETNTVVYADALEWNHSGTQVLYDALHRLPVAQGDSLEFWDINLLDISSGVITRVKTPTDNNTQVGNASFAETNDSYIVCDLFSEDLKISRVVAINLFNLTISVISENGMIFGTYPNLGHPRYSPDDTSVMFQQYDPFYRVYYLVKLSLNSDKMTPTGTKKVYYYGERPVWFVRGLPIIVEDDHTVPSFNVLYQNVPNPFNPLTTISYTVSEPNIVNLTVYDMLGQKIETLFNGYSPAGTFNATFNGSGLASGIYLYMLDVGNYSMTKKMILVK